MTRTTFEQTTADNSITISNVSVLSGEQPGELAVIKRNGTKTPFTPMRIETAIKKAFIAVKGDSAQESEAIHQKTKQLTQEVIERLVSRSAVMGGVFPIETVQDLVELALMREGEQLVARSYVLYREERRRAREQGALGAKADLSNIRMTLDDGSTTLLDMKWLAELAIEACKGLDHVAPTQVIEDAYQNLFDGVLIKDVYKALTMSARTLVEQEPNYTYVTARLLLQDLYKEAFAVIGMPHAGDLKSEDLQALYPKAFKKTIAFGIETEHLHPNLLDFDLDQLAAALQSERDGQLNYLCLQTLYDRYFIHHEEKRMETPQVFFMRVAMGLAHCEGDARNERAIEFYHAISSFDYLCSTPTLFNSGTLRPQLSSCYLTTIDDDLEAIYDAFKANALLSKFAGGIGNDWTNVRALGARIKGTNGKSLGVVPFMNVADATAVAVNQGGKRKGAVCGYLESWHLDIEEFLELRKNTGDERRRTHDMNTANWIPDLFMERLFEQGDWTLFSPNDVPDLHDLYGAAFKTAYIAYEEKARAGKIRSKTLPANTLWRKMLSMLFETGHPWVTFKDPCNLRSPQQHVGVVHSSNLCTEITLNTSKEEIAVCNLGSINLVQHLHNGRLDTEKLARTIRTAIRMLDNVIDINFYSVPQAENSNLKHRPIGLGLMGFQDALYAQKIPYASEAAVKFADESMEYISYYAIEASANLAIERGSYESFKGSLWNRGILPIDSIALLKESRGQYLEQDTSTTLDWASLRAKVKKGMRNSNTMAIAPTATISNIAGVSQSIEPTYQNLYVKSNLSGEFTVVNPYLVRDLKAHQLWDSAMVHDLKYYDGSLQAIDRIPQDLKTLYATAFEVEPKWLVECASRRQKWIDQGQSLNLYMAEPSGKKLDLLYRMAWLRGLKTTYYLRSIGASNTEKATISDGQLNAVSQNSAPSACSIDNPDCESCQ